MFLYLGTVELLICGSCAVTAAAMYQRNSYQMLGADCWNQVESIRLVQLEKTIWKTITLVNGEDSTGNWNMVFIIFHIFFASANPRMEHPENAPEKRYVKAGITVMQRETFAVLDLTCFDEPVFIPIKKQVKGLCAQGPCYPRNQAFESWYSSESTMQLLRTLSLHNFYVEILLYVWRDNRFWLHPAIPSPHF